MITLLTLTLKNFLSVGNITQVVRLDSGGVTLIMGENMDAAEEASPASRNGAGKTTILNALCYALFGTPLNEIKLDNLVNKDNNKNMLVTLDFQRDQTNYRIERGRRPNVFRFLANSKEVNSTGVEDETQGAKSDTQQVINSIIEMTPVLFRQLVALTTYADPFLKLPVSKQREVIEQLLGITILSQKSEHLRELLNGNAQKDIVGSRHEVKNEQFRIKTVQESNAKIERAIDEVRLKMRSWQSRRDARRAELTDYISSYGEIDFDAELEKLEQIEEWQRRQDKLSERKSSLAGEVKSIETQLRQMLEIISLHQRSVKEDQKDRFDRDVQRYRGEAESLDGLIEEATEALAQLEKKIDAPSEMVCKTCGQPLRDGEHLSSVIAELHSQRRRKAEEIDALRGRRRLVEEEIATLEAQRDEQTTAVLAENAKHASEVKRLERKAVEAADQLEEKQKLLEEVESNKESAPVQSLFNSRDEIWQARSLYEKLQTELDELNSAANPYEDQLESLHRTLQEVSYARLNQLVRLVEHQEFLLKILTDKNSFIRKTIIEQNLAYLNSRLSGHLGQIRLPHEVRFQSDLSVDINKMGKSLDFDNLSRGEQNRILLGLSWAFRDLFENMHVPINCMFVDEVLDFGMDPLGVRAVLEVFQLMEKRGKSVFLITHREELVSSVSRVIVAIRENDFTTYDLREAA